MRFVYLFIGRCKLVYNYQKKSINPQSLTRLVQELCVEMDEPEFMGYGAGALKEVYRAMRRGIEK
ncbi:hypothetical protein [Parabacteroides distasonis]|uniref:hypothetical protein n=1 Tax=Parabacteroides distasonis TaxID=823 RepID=UPI0034A53039